MNLGMPLATGEINEMKQCRHGYMIYNKHDQYVGYSFLHYGEFSQKEVELFEQIILPGMVVLDIGANIGAHTIFFAEKLKGSGAVFAFEPQRIVFQTLCGNIALNSIVNTQCFHAALGAEIGEVFIPLMDYQKEANYGGLSVGNATQGERVQKLTIDGMGLSQCHFMKIDVEGMEREVLLGATQTIKNFRPVLYVENDRAEKSAALISLLFELGYKLFWHLPKLYNADNYFKNPNNIFGEIVSVNMLCVPAENQFEINGLREVSGPNDTWQRV